MKINNMERRCFYIFPESLEMKLGKGYAAKLCSHHASTESHTSLHLEGIFITAWFQNWLGRNCKLIAQLSHHYHVWPEPRVSGVWKSWSHVFKVAVGPLFSLAQNKLLHRSSQIIILTGSPKTPKYIFKTISLRNRNYFLKSLKYKHAQGEKIHIKRRMV